MNYTPSPRERQIIELIALGYTNGEIASELHIAEQTVKKTIHRLSICVGAENRWRILLCFYKVVPLQEERN